MSPEITKNLKNIEIEREKLLETRRLGGDAAPKLGSFVEEICAAASPKTRAN